MFFKKKNDNNIDNNDKNAINIENVENIRSWISAPRNFTLSVMRQKRC